jgi:hypothetical protein
MVPVTPAKFRVLARAVRTAPGVTVPAASIAPMSRRAAMVFIIAADHAERRRHSEQNEEDQTTAKHTYDLNCVLRLHPPFLYFLLVVRL